VISLKSDDWSLKGKGQVVDYWNDGEDDNYELRRIHERFNEEPEAYLVSDIDVLREKLIEDIENVFLNSRWSMVEFTSKDFKGLINRRFGYETEE